MLIKVINWSFNQIPDNNQDNNVDFFLERDSWNDYGFYTSYYLHLGGKHNDDSKTSLIGNVKILKKGQKTNEFDLIPQGVIGSLTPEFCSLGQSLDYYQRIGELDFDLKIKILECLKDIIYSPAIKSDFKTEDGFTTSLLRFSDEDSDIFTLAPTILTGDFESLADTQNLTFDFKTSGMEKFAKFDFSSNEVEVGHFKTLNLPNRIIVIIGKNGTGKTTFISKLSRTVFSSTIDREKLKKVASIKPKGLGFPKIITISYSAFDTFKVPGVKMAELQQIIKEVENGEGRYVYCGIRNITKELTMYLETLKSEKEGYLTEKDLLNNKYDINILKTVDEINEEFRLSFNLIQANAVRRKLLDEVLNILNEESSFREVFNLDLFDFNSSNLYEIFNDLSTGHKFILHTIVGIIRNIEKNSLVLFDEPEIHLHPPLLSVLMKSLRFILNDRNSYMVVSTHSPVVVQETLSRHVFIIKRIGETVELSSPAIQTFGENIGLLSSHIFGLNSDITHYHGNLDEIANAYKHKKWSLEEKLNEISFLFDGQISVQARAYLMTKLMVRE